MKIVVVGLGYVGLSNAVLLAQHNTVIGVDISEDRVAALNNKKSVIDDPDISEYLLTKNLDLSASLHLDRAVYDADYAVLCTPTDYREEIDYFDTSQLEQCIASVLQVNPKAFIVVKSTVPVGFIDRMRDHFGCNNIAFSPEFLREGKALFDNLNPSRIIIGDKSKRAQQFAKIIAQGAVKSDINTLFTGTREAEAIKLFSNSYLAMRVAFFNELDTFAHCNNLSSSEIISGISHDPRIGNHYNNPSFGYGGYCLPKDTKQLKSNFSDIPQSLIGSIVDSNLTRKKYITDYLLQKNVNTIGVYRLAMKQDSDNFRQTAVGDIIKILIKSGKRVIVYEPSVKIADFEGAEIATDFEKFVSSAELIIANRLDNKLIPHGAKVFSRDLFGIN